MFTAAADLDAPNGPTKIDGNGDLITCGALATLLAADHSRPRPFRPAAGRSVFDLTDEIGRGVMTMVASEHRRSGRPVRFRVNLFAADGNEVPVQGTTRWDGAAECWIVDGLHTANGYRQRDVTPPRLGIAPQTFRLQ